MNIFKLFLLSFIGFNSGLQATKADQSFSCINESWNKIRPGKDDPKKSYGNYYIMNNFINYYQESMMCLNSKTKNNSVTTSEIDATFAHYYDHLYERLYSWKTDFSKGKIYEKRLYKEGASSSFDSMIARLNGLNSNLTDDNLLQLNQKMIKIFSDAKELSIKGQEYLKKNPPKLVASPVPSPSPGFVPPTPPPSVAVAPQPPAPVPAPEAQPVAKAPEENGWLNKKNLYVAGAILLTLIILSRK